MSGDQTFIVRLAAALQEEVASIGGDQNCGINNNWLPVVSRALLMGTTDDTCKLICDMAKPCMPQSMHDTPSLQLLLDSVDPTHEMNQDPDTKRELYKMFSNADNKIDKVLQDMILEENDCSHRFYALSVRVNIIKFLDGGETPKPRGRPPRGCKWDGRIGDWVESEETTDVEEGTEKILKTPNKTIKTSGEPPKIKRGPGRPPAGKVWDSTKGVYVDDEAVTDITDAATVPKKKNATGSKRSVGRPPNNSSWDAEQGKYVKHARIADDNVEQLE